MTHDFYHTDMNIFAANIAGAGVRNVRHTDQPASRPASPVAWLTSVNFSVNRTS